MPAADDSDTDERTSPDGLPQAPPQRRRGVAVNSSIFAGLTGLSRIAGLGREIIASSYFATSGAFSSFTIAFQVPNLLRTLVADQAVSAAFVPVFTDLLEQKRRREAFQLASSLFLLILAGLGALVAAFILLAPTIMPLLTGDKFSAQLDDLTVGLSRVLFPTVLLLGLNGLTLGILYAHDDFTIGGFVPLLWNLVIIAVLVPLRHAFHGREQLYAYAIAVLAGTLAQFLMTLPRLRKLGFGLTLNVNLRDPRVKQVLRLMLPVTFATGLFNFSVLINSVLGSRVSNNAPRAIDAAFRIYQLPQGVIALALATVIFPTLARFASRGDLAGLRSSAANGVRQNFLMLVPAAALLAVLATPITRVVFQHGAFGPDSTDRVSSALFWFSFALPLNGINLLLTRTFFSFRRAWVPTLLALANVAFNVAVSAALQGPFGIPGIVVGTIAGNVVMAVGQLYWLRRELGGFEGRRTAAVAAQVTAASALLAAVAYGAWYELDSALGRGVLAQVVSVGTACAAGLALYAAIVAALRIPEGRQLWGVVAGRLRRA